MRMARHLDDASRRRARFRQIQAVVATEGIGLQITLIVAQEVLRSIALVVPGQVKDVERMGGVAQINPEPCRAQPMSHPEAGCRKPRRAVDWAAGAVQCRQTSGIPGCQSMIAIDE